MPESGDPEKYPKLPAMPEVPSPVGEGRQLFGGAVMGTWAALNSFNAGELSEKMIGRFDVSQYGKGCLVFRNFLVTPYGAAERRPGTLYVAPLRYNDRATRLIPFVFSLEISYICEFGDRFIRFYRNDTFVTEIDSPYGADDLAQIQFVQSADVMTLVHPHFAPHELKRISADEFTIAEMKFTYPAVLDPNLENKITLMPSDRDGDITITAELPDSYDGEPVFTPDNVGGYFELIHTRTENDISFDFKANGETEPLEVFGYWSLTTHGTWTGELKVQRSFDHGATWADYRSYSSARDSNVSTSGEEEKDDVLYRLKMEEYEQSGSGTLKMCRALLSNPDFVVTGVVKITAYRSATEVCGTVIKKLGDAAPTGEWNEGAWSIRRGFPCAIAFFEERMMFGGTAHKPQTVWGSKTNDWNNFLLGSNDDDAIEFQLVSDTVNAICWMCSHDALVIGTCDSEWTLSASNSEEALTASNVRVRRQSVYGSSSIPARMVGDVILFVQRQGRKVREFVFSVEKNGYVSPDLTVLAEHITKSSIRETALQQQPDSILWCLLNDGTIAAMTYERDQEVCGWQRIATDGTVLSLAILPQAQEDQIYIAVQRNGKRMIERFAPREWERIADCVYVDSGVVRTGQNLETVSGLDHLEGRDVQILADGAVQPPRKVSGGKITLDTPADKIVAGLGFESLLSPMPIEIEMQNGFSMLRRKVIAELRIRVYNSIGGEARAGEDQFQKIISRDVLNDIVDAAVVPKTEPVQLQTQSGYLDAPMIEVRQTEPLPLNIAAIVAIYEVAE